MKYLFDSNVWIAIHRGNTDIRKRWEQRLPEDVFLCAPVLAELFIGAFKSNRKRENLTFVHEISFQHDCLHFGAAEASRFAHLTDQMKSSGITVKILDVQIAAIASVHGLRIVTHDIADFQRIPDIETEDWQV